MPPAHTTESHHGKSSRCPQLTAPTALSTRRPTLTSRLHHALSPLLANDPEKAFFSVALLVRGTEYSCQPPSSHITTNHPRHQSLRLKNHSEQGTGRGVRWGGSRMSTRLITPSSLIQRDGKGQTAWEQTSSGEGRSAAFSCSATVPWQPFVRENSSIPDTSWMCQMTARMHMQPYLHDASAL